MKKLFLSIIFLSSFLIYGQTTTENYVKTTSYLVETVDGNVTDDQKIESITYYDGLNRPKQGISLRAGGNRQDLITPVVYDQFGRKVKNHMPLAVTGNGDNYYTGNIETELQAFYRNKYPADFNAVDPSWDNPYTEKLFEDSPINRVKEAAFPGYDWRLGNGGAHTQKYDYKTNEVNEVIKYKVTYNTNSEPVLNIDGFYSQNALLKFIQKDENWTGGLLNTSETFTDKNGKTLLTNNYLFDNGQIKKLSTYYVNDDFGRLIYKLTPKQIDNPSNTTYNNYTQSWNILDFFESGTDISSNIKFDIINNQLTINCVGQIDINAQGGVLKLQTSKSLNTTPTHLPNIFLGMVWGSALNQTSIHVANAKIENGNLVLDRVSTQPVNWLTFPFTIDLNNANLGFDLDSYAFQYRYDDYNRLVEQKTPGRGWEYMVYDKLDRPVLSQDTNLKNQGKWLFTKYDVFGRVVYTGIFNSTSSRVALQSTLDSQNTIFENRVSPPITISGTTLQYSNQAFPFSNIEILTVNYYDSYVDYSGLSLPSSTFGVTRTLNTQGLPTVSKVRVLGTSQWITTLSTYDDEARVIYIDSKNDYLASRDITRLKLNYTGSIEETHVSHLKTGKPTINIRDYFHYDHIGRLKSHKQKIDNEPVQLINENFYDNLGHLHRKDVGGETVLDGYTDIVNMDVTFDGTISHTSGWFWPSRLKTKGAIVEDGGISFKLVGINNHVRVGLLKPQNSNSSNEYLDYGFYLEYSIFTQTYRVNIINNGNLQSTSYTYSPGNTFKVERIGNEVKYFRNGSLISTVTYVGNDESLTGKVAFSGPGGSIENVTLYGPNINKKLQNIFYKYNVRGWLTDINNVETDGLIGIKGNPSLFHFRINYNRQIQGSAGNVGLAEPLFNGNISQTTWRTVNQDTEKRSYGYKYDGLNRLKAAYSRKGNDLNSIDYHSLDNINYDLNGNIINLLRSGFIEGYSTPQIWDDLTYAYEGNKLIMVTELGNNSNGFVGKINPYTPPGPYPVPHSSYTYDANGNLKSDTGKNIVNISYNHLDLPVSVTILDDNQQGGYITYVYDATGVKLSKTVTPIGVNPNGIETQYDGNFIYEKSVTGEITLQFFSQPEGYVVPVAGNDRSVKGFDSGPGSITYSSYSYVFQYRDHLGNVRLSYSDLDLNGSIDPNTEIIEENHYYPFGLKHKGYNTVVTGAGNAIAQQYKFGGKQLQEELGLQWYDFGSRNYDAAIGRWFNTDPQNQFASPYVYAFNNPVIAVDPDGEWAFVPILIGAVIGAYSGGVMANGGEYNPFKWSEDNTWSYMLGGAIVGGISGGLGSSVATSGVAFSNTGAIAAASITNSFGTYMYTGGNTDMMMSIGVASFNASNGELGYIGKKGNSFMENLGYTLGAIANFNDIMTGFSTSEIGEVELVTEHSDKIGHSALVEPGTMTDNSIISFGPPDRDFSLNPFKSVRGSNQWPNHIEDQNPKIWRTKITGVNKSKILGYGSKLSTNTPKYNVYGSSCVTHTSFALINSGFFNIGIHPYILHAQAYLRDIGLRTYFSHYMQN